MDAMNDIKTLEQKWLKEERWLNIKRDYSAESVIRLRGSIKIEHTLGTIGARRLWDLMHQEGFVATLGAMTGAQAVQMVRAGLQAIYVSGWQVAADANLAGHTYPDLSIYPSNSAPALVRRINNALLRADQIDWQHEKHGTHWMAPIVADAESGFGGPIHAYELMRGMIEAGAAGVHFEDQLANEKKCGHLGGKVLVSTNQFIRTLNAARLASDVMDVPTFLIARTDALDARWIISDADVNDRSFLTGERNYEGYYEVRDGLDSAIARGLSYAPYCDALWFETHQPSLEEAKAFANAVHASYPGKILAYNLSPSFNWERSLDADSIARFQQDLADLGYKFQFVTLAGWHMVNFNAFDLAKAYSQEGMTGYVRLQRQEFAMEDQGYTAVRHQQEAGTDYFDLVAIAASGGTASTTAMAGSTEAQQFK